MGGNERLIEVLKRQEKRREIGVPIGCKLLLSVGELSVRKNHKIVVDALQMLPEDYWYVIVGRVALKDELMARDHTGRLKLLGYRDDIVDLLHCADVYVFPSLQKGLPVALVEAMAAEVPCVASRIRGNTDLLGNDGLFAPKDVIGFRDAIETNTNTTNLSDIDRIHIFGSETVLAVMLSIYEA